jgi:RecA/RadA recombinase
VPSLSTEPTNHKRPSNLFVNSGFIYDAFQGFPVGGITHIYGSAGSGKSTLAMQALNHVAIQGYGSFLIDCNRSYSPRRLLQLADHPSDLSNRLTVFLPRTFREQTELISKLHLFFDPTIRLIIIDPITGLYRQRMTPRTMITLYRELSEHQLPRLLGLAQQYQLAVLAINQVSTWKGEDRPVGGDAMGRYAAMEIHLQRVHSDNPTYRWMVVHHRNQILPQRLLVQLRPTGFQLLHTKEGPCKD